MLRKLMEDEMYREIGDPNGCSRYGTYFYVPKEELTRAERKFNDKALERGKINLLTLATLSDTDFLDSYRRYRTRYATWM